VATLHITPGPRCWSPWGPVPAAWGPTVLTGCCVRRVPRREAEVRFGFQAWYDPTPRVACRSGRGCKADPRRRAGSVGRAMFAGLA
jgi:hypothetical protein